MKNNRSGYVRVKEYVQIAIEIVAIEAEAKTRKKNMSASDAIWSLVKECRPEIAKEAIERAKQEGFPVPSSDMDK